MTSSLHRELGAGEEWFLPRVKVLERSAECWALSRCFLALIIRIFALGKKTQPTDFNGSSAADFKKDFPFGAELQDKQEGETCFKADLASVKLWCLKSPRLVCST